ncbi:MAG: N-acetyl-gamma-glutamyl-phosphate reductase [Elusimicrobiota bacterium]|jgi:N-acetyl-gamma-glutamyl-phosphate reductase|nr:N-acetyl-gamma-glutamyl-phosphate reductase [Elusimicrobiota bacterium]
MIKASIIGITGYTGEELLKILSKHNQVEIVALYGRAQSQARKIGDIYPHFASTNLIIEPLNIEKIVKDSDIVFLALPHAASFEIVPQLLEKGVKVIDLSADFRIKNHQVYEDWYKVEHKAKKYLPQAVYGLSELNREKIKTAALIANPGCYPTTVLLGCAPAIENNLADFKEIIIDAKSGISGAGRKAAQTYFETEHPNCRPYKIAGTHRHIPEIEQEISALAKEEIKITFTPQIIPIERGMLSAVYLKLKDRVSTADIINKYKAFYDGKPFVKVLEAGVLPSVKDVADTNFCEISVKVDERTNKLIVFSAVDNLVKGASGQAVQNMNIIFGLDETLGLI